MLPDELNPLFKAWFAGQSANAQTAILAYYDQTATDPSIAQDSDSADYARRKLLIDHCAAEYGYQ